MDISINWIKEFVNLPEMDSNELAVKFTMATCEVEGVKETNSHLKKVVTSKIVEVEDHPDSDKLHLVTVDTGNGTEKVVCGAPNVDIGSVVPYAPLGTTFPEGFTLTPKKIRGVESKGMLCGETELELGDDDSGLMELDANAELGKPLAEHFNIASDTLLDIDNKSITHRPDLWGHYGMAREFALVFDAPRVKVYDDAWAESIREKVANSNESPIVPVVEKSACLGYYGLSIDNVEVKESPHWIKEKLIACGLRPINTIVDISNYVMLELGIPMHIYDRERIEGNQIIIKELTEDTKFTTLDEVERELIAGDSVVADSSKPLVIAGIMGGANSGVQESTTKIFVEVANWIDERVRKTSTRIGLRTDSSQRYEKSLDTQSLEKTMLRAVEIILELCPEAQVIGEITKAGPEVEKEYTPLVITISTDKITTTLGKEVSDDEIVRILEGLEFTVENNDGELTITVPSFRATKDIEYDADIIEEIGRIIGYDNIVPEPRVDVIQPTELSITKKIHRKIQDFMVLNGTLLEVMTNPMVGEELLKKAEWPTLNEELILVNALSKDHDRMRPSMIPSTLEAVALNSKHFSSFGMFELGRTYIPNKKSFSEEHNNLTITMYSRNGNPFMEVANLVERLLKFLNVPSFIVPAEAKFPSFVVDRDWAGLHPNEQLDIKIMGRNFGSINTIHPVIAKKFKIKGNVVIATIDISAFENIKPKEKVNYKPLAKFQQSNFDCTVVADRKEPVANLITVLQKLKLKNVIAYKVVDVFYPKDEESKSVTLRVSFQDPNNTLDSKFLEESQNKIVQGLAKAGFPLKA